MKKRLTLPLAGLALCILVIGLSRSFVGATSTSTYCKYWFPATCLYFANSSFGGASGHGTADANVLPVPALTNVLTAGDRTQSLIDTMNGYLNSANPQAQNGAAFIIDDMLHYNGDATPPGGAVDPTLPVGGGVPAGVAYAKQYFTTWANMVKYFGDSTNTADHGINWNYNPPNPSSGNYTFCSNANTGTWRFDSAYDTSTVPLDPTDPGLTGPVVFPVAHVYNSDGSINAAGLTTCEYEYNASMPIILFYWNGGAISYGIGAKCGNVEYSITAVPPGAFNHPPVGTISVACTNGQQYATVTFSDPDAPTTATITVGSNPPFAVTSGSTVLLSAADPINVQTVTLAVQDTGPGSPGGSVPFSTNSAVPCVSSTCSLPTLTPDTIDPYMTYALGVSMTISSGAPAGATMTLSITPPAGVAYNPSIPPVAATASGTTESATFNNIPATGSPGTYTAHWSLVVGGATVASCSGTFPVAYLPYVDVFGGDTMVGLSPTYTSGSSACQAETTAPGVYAGAYSWNNHTTNYTGAGSEYAVMALGGIMDYASALPSANPAPFTPTNTPPWWLSFANAYTPADATKLSPLSGLFGGYFGDTGNTWTGSCDFTSDITTMALNTAQANTAIIAAEAGIPNATQKVIYANGDVYIGANITYNNSSWSKPSDIPSFKLVVVGGNIFINSNVTRLDGLYVSEPSGGAGGNIYTCSTATSPAVPVLPTTAGFFTTCNHPLLVNGSFVAKEVWLGRTFGSVGQASKSDTATSNHAAETFNYTPELWLPRSVGPPSNSYEAIIGLPPVL